VKPRVEVRVALDFLETGEVMRDDVMCEGKSADDASRITHHASLPHNYVPEPHHRIEIYRKLAQATDKPALDALQRNCATVLVRCRRRWNCCWPWAN